MNKYKKITNKNSLIDWDNIDWDNIIKDNKKRVTFTIDSIPLKDIKEYSEKMGEKVNLSFIVNKYLWTLSIYLNKKLEEKQKFNFNKITNK